MVLLRSRLLSSLIFFAALCSLFHWSIAQSESQSVICHALSTENNSCSHCIQLNPKCAWCAATGYDLNNLRFRCDTLDRLRQYGCTDIQNPESTLTKINDAPLSDAGVDDPSTAVQIKPQVIRLAVRPRDPRTFQLTFKQALDYPVDLYYMMDLSRSMSDDKQKLTELGELLAARMREVTKNFRLGFGSFVDKKVMPFVDARPERANEPCTGCVPPYGFKHHMSLSENAEEFTRKVNSSNISGNLDAPEGGFDAIIQALMCEDAIGWRDRARKMIVFSSDAGFHYAGDGKLGGIVVPNDGQCHLDNIGEYTMSSELDYPSISQIHKAIRDKKANVIFAVTQEQQQLYRRLKEALPDVSTTVGELAEDSRNVVELVKQEYLKITEKLIMVDNATSSMGLKISYATPCKSNAWNETNVCDGVGFGDSILFNVTLEVVKCSDQREFTIRIGPSGLTDELIIHLKVLCDCDCTKDRIEFHPDCNGKGDMVCGVCICRGNAVGRNCECDPATGITQADLEARCRKGNDTRAPLCSGRGRCQCGECICFQPEEEGEVITGRYCECDNFNCPRYDRKICNNHGKCECQECICESGWTGRACECPTSNKGCFASNGLICNGRGICECGRCKCFTDERGIRYTGPTCELCPTCPSKCVEMKSCVMCTQWETGPYNETRCAQCGFRKTDQLPEGITKEDLDYKNAKYIPVDELPDKSEYNTTECQFVDPEDDCTFYFAFIEDPVRKNITVWVRREKECPPPVPVLAIVLGVIAGIVLIGLLLLLCWKLLTILHDRREYAKFERERLNAKWDTGENPIFNPATTTFKNPAYGGKAFM